MLGSALAKAARLGVSRRRLARHEGRNAVRSDDSTWSAESSSNVKTASPADAAVGPLPR